MERTLKAVNGSLNVTVPKQLADALAWKKGQRIAFSQRQGGLYLQKADTANRTPVTIGYAGHSSTSFVNALRRDGVEVLIDIRELPLSRRRGFSKSSLAAVLGKEGIEYRHMKALLMPGREARHTDLPDTAAAALSAPGAPEPVPVDA